jgi:ankyrin repeat protein
MLLWPNNPLLVLLEIVGPQVLSLGIDRMTLLRQQLARLADPSDYSTHENRLILERQLIEHGASVNSITHSDEKTPLHFACRSSVVTNLAFIQLLLENGADPNAQNKYVAPPLPRTIPRSPATAKLLLEWQSTDVNVTTNQGDSYLALVRFTSTNFSDAVTRFSNSDQSDVVKSRFVLQQWREIEEILVEKGAVDTKVIDD